MGTKNENKLAFIGGDMRQVRAMEQMAASGAKTAVFGFNTDILHKIDNSVIKVSDFSQIPADIRVFVLPLPYSTDGVNINAPYFDEQLNIGEVLNQIPTDSLVIAGRTDNTISAYTELYGLKIIDYFNREELMVLNAVPTAEGAIQLAMEETAHTINGSECLVAGNGRIGKILARMLWGIGAKVTVAARKPGDLAQIRACGYNAVPVRDLSMCAGQFDVIFNTVPYLIFDAERLRHIKQGALVIDLASKPGGVDFEAAADMGLRAVRALSLPGKVAPDTAGDIIKNTILNILEETEHDGA